MLMFLLLASSDEEEGVLKNEAPFLNRDCIVEAMTIMDNMCSTLYISLCFWSIVVVG